jgi:hypothetical protein
VAATIAVGLTALWVRAYDREAGPAGSFQAMRAPDWAVWLVILTAVLCFVERNWPNPVVRMASWNSAIALASVYWLNGWSIVAYGLTILRPHVLLSLAIVFALVYLGQALCCLIGLFDTWGNFRGLVDKAAAARQRPKPPDPGDFG